MRKFTLLLITLFVCSFGFAQPANDTCATAETIMADGTLMGDTSTASSTATAFCGTGDSAAPDVWYTFVDGSGTGSMVDIDLCGSLYDTKIQVWSGDCMTLVCVAGNDDFCGLDSGVSFMTDGSSAYYVKIFGFNTGSGAYTMNVAGLPMAPAPPPSTTDCGLGLPSAVDPPDVISVATTTVVPGVIGSAPGEYTIESISFDAVTNWANDIDLTLTAPGGGASIDLSSNNGPGPGAGTLMVTEFRDDSANDVTAWTAGNMLADYQAEGGLLNTVFAGQPANGGWSLFFDDFAGDGGTWNSWCITLSFNPVVPIMNCPMDVIATTDPGVCGAVVVFADAVAIDPDGGPVVVTQTAGLPSGSEFPVGVSTVEFTATDQMGESSTCTFTITITDDEAPTMVCPDAIVMDNDPGVCGAAVTVPMPTIMDNCPVVANNPPAMVVGPVTDFIFAGNGLDDTPTTLVGTSMSSGGDVTMDLEFGGDWSFSTECFDLEGPDGSQIFFECAFGTDCITYNRTFTVAEATWNNWVTTFGPDLTFTLLADADVNTFCAENFYQLTATQGAAGGTLTNDYNNSNDASDVYPVGTTTVTFTYTDEGGNAVDCTVDITVNDVEAPVIVCQGEVAPITIGEDFNAGLPAGWSTAINTGTCDWENGTDLPTGDDFATPGMFFDDDACGSGAPASNVSLLSDVYDIAGTPAATLGYDVAFQESGDQEFTVEVWDGAAWQQVAFYDEDLDPDIQTESFDVSAFANNAFQVRWTFDDGAGQWGWHAGVDNFNLTYQASTTALDVVLDANGMASIPASDLIISATDNCGNTTVTVGGAPMPSSLETTFAGGNGLDGNMFDINTLEDVVFQSFDVNLDTGIVDDIEVYFKTGGYAGFEEDPGAWTLLGSANVTSAGDGIPTPLNLNLNQSVASGQTVAFYVTTTAGGMNYTNGGTVGDVFAADANIEFLEGAGKSYPFGTATFEPRVFNGNIHYDLGGGPSGIIDFDCSQLGENIIEVTVTDDAGNISTCLATVNVIDDTAPVLVCADVTIGVGPDGTTTIDPMDLLATIPSTFQVMTISSDNQSGAEGFTDFTVPVMTAETVSFDWDYSTMDGAAFDSFGYLVNGVYTEVSDPAGANNQSGNTSVTLAAGDDFGFRSQSDDGVFGAATTTVSNFLPGFTGQFDPANWVLTLTNSDGDAFFVEIPGGPLSFDACGITVLAVDITEVTCADIGMPVTITVFASDSSGNSAVCTATVTVVDELAPVLTCPADQTVDPGPGNLFYEVPDYFATGEAIADDNCTDPVVITTQDPAAGSLIGDGVYTVIVTAEDEYGNVATCDFELTVDSVLGVDESELNNSVSMYPNPAQEQVIISNSSNIQLERVMMYDVTGKLVNEIDMRDMQSEKVIDISSLQSGMYMVQIQGEKASVNRRLIKE